MVYNIGQVLVLSKDIELNGEISGDKKIKRKGTKMFVGANKECPSLHFLNGDVVMLPKERKIEGYSAKGISEWLYLWLNSQFPLDDMLENYSVDEKEFKHTLIEAFEELEFYNNEGNIG